MQYSVDLNKRFEPNEKLHIPLVHMTHSWELLQLILIEGLKPSYCEESISNGHITKGACFPMVSLSNVTIEDGIRYQRSYGTLGVAFDVSWGQENDFNPVLYLDQNSDMTSEIIDAFASIKGYSRTQLADIVAGVGVGPKHLLTRNIIKIFAHSKNYDGLLIRRGTLVHKKYQFGLEREWRKVILDQNIPYFLVGDEIEDKKEFSSKLANLRIRYTPEQLAAVIVETEWQEEEVKQIIMTNFSLSHFPPSIKVVINPTRHMPDEG